MGYGKEPGAYLAPDRIRDIIRYTIMYYLLNFDTYNINTIKPIITVRNYHAVEKESGTEYRIKRRYCGIENLHDCTERIVSMLMPDDFEYIIRKINDVILFEFDTDDVRCFDKNLRIIFQTKRYLILEDDYSRTKIAYNAAVLKFLKELGA